MTDYPKLHRDDLPEFARKQPSPKERNLEARDYVTPRHERFCHEYIKDFSVVNAYERAGYKGKQAPANAYRLFKMPKIQQRIAELKAEVVQEQKLTIQKVCDSLERVATKAEDENRFSAAITGWKYLGDYLGMFVNRQQVDITVNKSVEELDEEIAKLQKIIGSTNDEGPEPDDTGNTA